MSCSSASPRRPAHRKGTTRLRFSFRRSIALATRAPRSPRRAHQLHRDCLGDLSRLERGHGAALGLLALPVPGRRLHEEEGAHNRSGAHGGGGDGPGRHGRCAQGGPDRGRSSEATLRSDFGRLLWTSSSAQAAAKALSLSHGRRFRRDAVAADGRAGDRHRPAVCARQSARRRGRRRKRLRGPVGSRAARPAYRVRFKQARNPEIVIHRDSGVILADEDSARRFHFLVTQLHQYNYFGFKKTLTAIAGVPAAAPDRHGAGDVDPAEAAPGSERPEGSRRDHAKSARLTREDGRPAGQGMDRPPRINEKGNSLPTIRHAITSIVTAAIASLGGEVCAQGKARRPAPRGQRQRAPASPYVPERSSVGSQDGRTPLMDVPASVQSVPSVAPCTTRAPSPSTASSGT